MSISTIPTLLIKLIPDHPKAEDLFAKYTTITGDQRRQPVRMALLKLIEEGRVSWNSNGTVTLSTEYQSIIDVEKHARRGIIAIEKSLERVGVGKDPGPYVLLVHDPKDGHWTHVVGPFDSFDAAFNYADIHDLAAYIEKMRTP